MRLPSFGRVLIVDDAEYIREILQEFLEDLGYATAAAADGEAAIRIAETFQPDVVLLDLWMPGMNGIDVFTELRLRDPRLPVIIIVTGDDDERLGWHLLSKGAFDYIPKPFHFDVLECVVAAAIASPRGP